MKTNTAKAKWKNGEVTHGAWLSIPSSFSAEVMAHQPYDWINIDMQHGVIDYQVAVTMLQAINTTETIPFVRVPWNEPGIIMKMLDAGAMGVIIPMVNTVEEAKAAVGACRYFPNGYRSFGPTRVSLRQGSDYYAKSGDEIAVIPMIETQQALDNLDDILDVPGIDAVYVGPADLSITLGLPPGMSNEGAFEEARIRIAEACRKRGIAPGIHASAALYAKHAEAGYQMITVTSDNGAMVQGAMRDLAVVKEGAKADTQGKLY